MYLTAGDAGDKVGQGSLECLRWCSVRFGTIGNANRYPIFESNSVYATAGGLLARCVGFGQYGLGSAYTAVRVLMNTGNITSGTATLYGRKKN
jgi:hypothetical protein